MRHKGEDKVEVAPNLVRMIQHFNRVCASYFLYLNGYIILDVCVLDVGCC